MRIRENYVRITEDIVRAASTSGRKPSEISVIAVTKTHPVETIQAAIDCGIKLFGENRIQEAKQKIPELSGDFSFHLIGHLQSNKARDAVQLFDFIHSIDKLSTADKVNSEAERIHKVQNILVQVNTSFEDSKNGVKPEEAMELCSQISKLEHLSLHGLMTIGPFTGDTEKIRNSFRTLRKLRDDINSTLTLSLTELSMGMSSDYAVAVEEGATIVRVGSAIFGERNY